VLQVNSRAKKHRRRIYYISKENAMQEKWQQSHGTKNCSKCSLSGERFVQGQYVPESKAV
jgi:hypothetical protein